MLNRQEYVKKSAKFFAFSGEVEWTRTSYKEMPSPFPGLPQAEKVGYSSVVVTKKEKNREYTAVHTFSNYDSFASWNRDEQRYFYPSVGKLLSTSDYRRRIEYEYQDINPKETVMLEYFEYLPFKYKGSIYSYKTHTQYQIYHCGKIRLQQAKEYTTESNAKYRKLRLTTIYTYDNETGNVLNKEVVNGKDGDTYSTIYRYPYITLADAIHDGTRCINVPYETIYKKNGKIIAAEVTQFTSSGWNGSHAMLPEKTFSFSTETPLNESDYQYAAYRLNTLDPRHKPVAVYGYDYYNRLAAYQITGQEQIGYEWDEYNRLVKETVGDMVTRYKYNVYGPTSVTDVNGNVTSTEYDALGQPILVKDHAGNILKKMEYEYNIK
jgi:YD repeat-containing protein